jgi:hypothetical protein
MALARGGPRDIGTSHFATSLEWGIVWSYHRMGEPARRDETWTCTLSRSSSWSSSYMARRFLLRFSRLRWFTEGWRGALGGIAGVGRSDELTWGPEEDTSWEDAIIGHCSICDACFSTTAGGGAVGWCPSWHSCLNGLGRHSWLDQEFQQAGNGPCLKCWDRHVGVPPWR